MESEEVIGSKVILRGKRMSDATDDYAWRSDEELCRLDAAMILNIPFEHFVRSFDDEISFHSPRRRRFAVDTLDGKHIGNCMYYNIDKVRKEAELGVMIGDRDYWNQGYGADAVMALLSHIFSATDIERIYLHTLEWNVRAQQCFGKCGFVPYRQHRRYNGVFIVMETYRSDWLSHPSRKAGLVVKQKQEG